MKITAIADALRALEDPAMSVAATAVDLADALRNARDDLEVQMHRLIKDGADSLDVDERAAKVKAVDNAVAVLDALVAITTVFVRQNEALVEGLLEASK